MDTACMTVKNNWIKSMQMKHYNINVEKIHLIET